MLKLRDFLKTFDGTGLLVAIYDSMGDEPLWTGEYSSTPWWLTEAELDFSEEGSPDWKICEPVDFRNNFDGKGRPGIVIRVK